MSYDDGVFQTYVGEVPMFRACSEEEFGAVAYLASPQALEAGTEIVREGDTGDDFYVLMMGTATVSRQGHDVGRLEPGTSSASSRCSIPRPGTLRSPPTSQ
jgi:CRP-like cAMP-binding protein